MKKKDIVTIVICVIMMGVALYFGLKMAGVLGSKKNAETTAATQENVVTFTGNIDQQTLDSLGKYSDYGEASLDNVGRVNPFGPIN